MGLIIGLILVCIYIAVPLPVQLILLVVNFLLPDSIYAIDEIIMAVSTLKKMSNLANIIDFVSEHKFLAVIIGAVAVIVLFLLIRFVV